MALIVAGPLVAQQATDTATTPATAADATSSATSSSPGLYLSADPNAIYASDLIGMEVYSSATDYATEYGNNQPATADVRSQWDDIGEINDIVLSQEGSVKGVLVDVGGFLGIGVHTVALEMSQIHFLRDEGDKRFAAVTSSREALEAAPEYQRPEDQTAATASPNQALGATSPQAFADIAGSSNMFEIQSSQFALDHATAEDVRAFAQHMIDDHTAAGEKMKAAAAKDGVTPPAAMAEKEQAQLGKLQSSDGAAFDHAYLAAQVTAHDEAVRLFATFSTQGQEGALRAFAAETLPTLKEHQATVHQMAGSQ